jgi:hypothetical protein
MDVIADILAQRSDLRATTACIHLKKVNRVVAEQLNFALDYVLSMDKNKDNPIIGMYNADSVFDAKVIDEVREISEKYRSFVAQQSSLFTHNTPALGTLLKLLPAAHGLYQSAWSITHEVPRFLTYQWLRVNNLPQVRLLHCVGHGLFADLETFFKLGKFPVTKYGGEDLAFGFIARAAQVPLFSLKTLENSETPHSMRVLTKQLASWYLAVLGYFEFRRFVPTEFRRGSRFQVAMLTILGIADAARWLGRGFFLLLGFWICAQSGTLPALFLLYLLYCFIPVGIMCIVWLKQQKPAFPRPRFWPFLGMVAVYPLVPVIRSFPALVGTLWGAQLLWGRDFFRPKTER